MLREVIKDDSYFVIYLGNRQYARWVNDCAWHPTSIAGASRLSKTEVNKTVEEVLKAGYEFAEPRAVDLLFNVYDVPKSDKDVNVPTFDVSMYGHPYYLYPRMAKRIIELKTDYIRALGDEDMEKAVLTKMCHLIHEYSERGVKFCPRCNKIDEGTILTPVTFGRVLTWRSSFNAYEGYVCDGCEYQSMNKIEHWS